MSRVPVHPYQIITFARLGKKEMRKEIRNAENLAQAYEIRGKELNKPSTRRVEVHLIIDQSERHGGLDV